VELSKLQKAKESGQSTGLHDGALENVERALRRSATSESTHLEGMVPLLATIGSAAPFIGLFGTVIGIIDAFRSIASQGSANLATVAPGIAEALGTTAVGLVAAVPAVMAFNFFQRKIKVLMAEMDAFGNDFLNIVKRHFLR
jgi:biopolymer transport protein TolQ